MGVSLRALSGRVSKLYDLVIEAISGNLLELPALAASQVSS
jgi:hypothetical protein